MHRAAVIKEHLLQISMCILCFRLDWTEHSARDQKRQLFNRDHVLPISLI